MDHPFNDDAIQRGLPPAAPSPAAPSTAGPVVARPDRIPRGLVAGLVSGLLFGPLTGAVICWLVVANDFLAQGALVGMGLGLILGPLIGWLEGLRRGEFVRADTATLVGAFFGVFPGVMGIATASAIVGLYSVGMFFIGPMIGALLGALVDRAVEAQRNRVWRDAVIYGTLAVLACGGLGWWLAANPTGPDIAILKRELRSMMVEKWAEDPGMGHPTIRNVVLVRDRDGVYSGRVDAAFDGQPQSFVVELLIEGHMMRANWHPIDNP